MKDIYKISSDEVIGIIEKNRVRFRVVLDRHKDLLRDTYKEVPSWLRFQIGMRKAGRGNVLDEIEEIDNTFLLDQMQDEVLEALQGDDTERLKALQLATGILVNREKLGGDGKDGDEGGAPMAMTINVSGVKGRTEKDVEKKHK
jgi:hypothetical protein